MSLDVWCCAPSPSSDGSVRWRHLAPFNTGIRKKLRLLNTSQQSRDFNFLRAEKECCPTLSLAGFGRWISSVWKQMWSENILSITKIDCVVQPLDLMWKLNVSVVRRCLWCQAVDGFMDAMLLALSNSDGIGYMLGSKELKIFECEGFQISFLVFCFSGSVKSSYGAIYFKKQSVNTSAPLFPPFSSSLLPPCWPSSGWLKWRGSLPRTCAGF